MSCLKWRRSILPGLMLAVAGVAAGAESRAREILDVSGVKGGLVVQLGCGDGELTAALRVNDRFLVQSLDVDAKKVAAARRRIQALGRYGKVAVDTFDGRRLPFIDGTVNLLVAENLGDVTLGEVLRALAPRGVACIRQGGEWVVTRKPWPDGAAEWTHHMYDASGVGAGADTRLGPPRRLQWEAGPRFGRSHENMSSVSGLVSAGGRVFSIIDEGPQASIYLPPKWSLSARDAFNGVRLWTLPLERWHAALFPLKSGPLQLPRRLVAAGDRVYATLGLYAPVSELDAATGEIIRTYEGTEHAEELLFVGGKLIVLTNDDPQPIPYRGRMPAQRSKFDLPENTIVVVGQRSVAAFDARIGKAVWKQRQGGVTPLTIAADEKRIYFMRGGALRALELDGGAVAWERQVAAKAPKLATNLSPTVFVYKDTVFAALGGKLNAFDAASGEALWSATCATQGYQTPAPIMAVNGLIWDVAVSGEAYRPNLAALPKMKTTDIPAGPGVVAKRQFVGYDPRTGEVGKTLPIYGDQGYGVMHHRCHTPRASGKFLLTGYPGIEFIDTDSGRVQSHSWIRGTCLYGFLPANGLIYTPPHICACYAQGKLTGFLAVAPERRVKSEEGRVKGERLEKGTAFGAIKTIKNEKLKIKNGGEWATFRGDAARSGSTAGAIPTELDVAWTARVGGKLTQSTIADGQLFVASVDTHTVYALDVGSGETLWRRTVGGRVDSPPTIHDGMAIFGSRDGFVYCLDARSGELVWRFRAAPADRRLVSYGQVESVWPVHGSVLVESGALYFVAGRSSFLDDGLFLYRLEPRTGKQLSRTPVRMLGDDGRQPSVLRLQMAAAMPDILSSNGERVFMRHYAFDLAGQSVEQDVDHLFCPTGFLDDSWFRRSYWLYGNVYFAGAQGWATSGNVLPSGRIMSVGGDRVYGFGRNYYPPSPGNRDQMYARGERELLFASAKLNFTKEYQLEGVVTPYAVKTKKPQGQDVSAFRKPHVQWAAPANLRVQALVLAGDGADAALFVAGSRGDWITSAAAYEGREGNALVAFSAKDGKQLAERDLPAPPVFDGMSAAGGRLFVSTKAGEVICFAGKER